MLVTQNLQFAYDSNNRFEYPDIKTDGTTPLAILGSSGSGKTTLLHLLGGLLKPGSGSIEIGDTKVSSFSDKALDQFRGKNIGIIFQKSHFVNALKVMDNLLLAQYLAGTKQDTRRAQELLDRLGIGDKSGKKVTNLSIGEQQRLNIARAMMNNPKLVLADEPTSALDDENCQKVLSLLKEQCTEIGAQLVVVTHDQRLKTEFTEQITL